MKYKNSGHWISLCDLMSGLMIIFMVLFLALMTTLKKEYSHTNFIENFQNLKDDLYYELYNEFKDDLIRWHAEINKETLIISFNEPEILFLKGQDQIKPLFRDILNNFFPRYVKILSKAEYKTSISEIRIEGHTSSEWNMNSSNHDAYIKNMNLSQRRTSRVLNYLLNMKNINNYIWMRKNIVSVGYSSSKIRKIRGVENKLASRRVDFRVITDAESKIYDFATNNNSSKSNL